MQDDARTRPLRIDADRAAGTLRLEWADGHQTTLRHGRRCAGCARARTAAARRGCPAGSTATPRSRRTRRRLVDVALVGNYAIQPTWGDGHDSGFHSFMLLREQCPCDDCAADRARRQA